MYGCIDTIVADVRAGLHESGILRTGETVRVLIDNCALLEYHNGRSYSYRAVNIYDLKARHLFHLEKPLTTDRYDHTADLVLQSPVNYHPENCPRLNREQRASALLLRIFTEIYPAHGFSVREGQLELAEEMLTGLMRGRIELCEAGVGSGKTHAYLTACAVHRLFTGDRRPAVIATSSIALQRAILDEYLPQISEILLSHKIIEKPLAYRLRKGKAHYACDLRLSDYCDSLSGWPEVGFLDYSMLASLLERDASIDLARYPLSPHVRSRICVKSCPEDCRKRETCRFLRLCNGVAAGGYDFLIVHHNFALAGLRPEGGKLLPDFRAIVFDEAHKLVAAARQMYGKALSREEIPTLIRQIEPGRVKNRVNRKRLSGAAWELAFGNGRLFDKLEAQIPHDPARDEQTRFAVRFDETDQLRILKLASILGELPELCNQYGDSYIRQRARLIRRSCREIAEKLKLFLLPDDQICWIDREAGIALRSMPKELSHMLYQDLWSRDAPFILTSGTLSVGGSFTHLRRVTGIEQAGPPRIGEINIPSPYDYEQNTLLYLPAALPFPEPESPAYLHALADELVRLIEAANGHMLILFTSYWLLEQIFRLVSGRVKYPLFQMGRRGGNALAPFLNSKNGVLFASDQCGEGIDLPGDILSCVAVPRLPFAVPDPVSEWERSLYNGLSEYLNAAVVPNMLIRLKQYCGRLIRTETDTGIIAILDSRAAPGSRYHKAVRTALPPMPETGSVYHVWAFLHNRKENEYFKQPHSIVE